MLKFLRRFNYALALLYPLGWLAWATSLIGSPPSVTPVSWAAAWTFALVIASAVWLGFMAGRESAKP